MSSGGFSVSQIEKTPQSEGQEPKAESESSLPAVKGRSYTIRPDVPTQMQTTLEVGGSNPPPAPKPVATPKPQTAPKPPQKPKPNKIKKPPKADDEDEDGEEGKEEDEEDDEDDEEDEEDEVGAGNGTAPAQEPKITGVPTPIGFPKKWFQLPIDKFILNGFRLKRTMSPHEGRPDILVFERGNEQHPIGTLTTQWYNFLIRVYPMIVDNPDAWYEIVEQIKLKRFRLGSALLSEEEKQAYKVARDAMRQFEQKLGEDLDIQRESADAGQRALAGLGSSQPTLLQRGNQMRSELRIPGLMVPKNVVLRKDTLFYYAWAYENRGYKGTLGDFMNDCVEAYMVDHGITPAIVMGLATDQDAVYRVR